MACQLLHITDLHLLTDPAARLHGWHVERAFASVLAAAVARYPDYDALVLGGDLVDDESAAGYRRLDARLAALGRPVLAMAGNHDDPARMARYLAHARLHAGLAVGGWSLIALASHRAGSEAGALGGDQLAALERALDDGQTPALVFVHHPPCALDSAWIDAIGLQDAAALARVLTARARVKAVVCGHAHQAARRRVAGLDCWVTPATMRQFRPASPSFAEDRRRAPGYRWLFLRDDGGVTTRVHRVAAARAARG